MIRVCLVIGRFHPLTLQCEALLKAKREAGYDVKVCIIGANAPRSHRYPFSAEEQIAMAKAVGFEAVAIEEVLGRQARHAQFESLAPKADILLFDTGYGRFLHEDWSGGSVEAAEAETVVKMVQTKDVWLETGSVAHTSEAIQTICDQSVNPDQRAALWAEEQYVQNYKQSWLVAPYPPVLVTADVLILCNDKVLLIERGGFPGKGLWAMPGGFVNPEETLFEAACRELQEETGMRLSYATARDCLVAKHAFDDPDRSSRGRTVTHAFHFELTGPSIGELEAGDDASALKWIDVDKALKMRPQMFEDHYLMMSHLLAARMGRPLELG